MIKLRPYQEDLIQGLRNSFSNGNRRIVLAASTGSGKTVMFSYMVKQHLKKASGKVLILTDRINILKQANGTFDRFDIEPELITAGSAPDLSLNCHVAMIETLHRRAEAYKGFLASRTLIVIDEAHKTAFNKLFPYISDNCLVIGATATPVRTGNQPSMSDFYEDIVQQVDTPDLIGLGNLAACHTFGVKMDLSNVKRNGNDYDTRQLGDMYQESEVFKGVIENYNRLTPETKAICFASNIESAVELCTELNSAGISAVVIHSKQDSKINETLIDLFLGAPMGRSIVLINVGILTAGFDCPDIETVILYRATTSVALFLQMVGRGSRPALGKDSFTLLDFGNNISNHDFWEARRTWSLEKEEKKLGMAPVKICPKCGAFLPSKDMQCICGHIFEPPKIEPKSEAEVFLEPLLSMDKQQAMKKAVTCSLQELAFMSKAKLISPYWVMHQLKTLYDAKEFVNLMGYKRGWLYLNKNKYAVLKNL
jgi:superfamily II DNA or RNA helicase